MQLLMELWKGANAKMNASGIRPCLVEDAVDVAVVFTVAALLLVAEAGAVEWVEAHPDNSPVAVVCPAMAYDSSREVTVLFGGRDAGEAHHGETWEWDGADWTLVETADSPPARSQSGMCYDASRERMVLFGGLNSSGDLDDTWEYYDATWHQVITSSTPTARSEPGICYDSIRHRVVLYGGHPDGRAGDTWEYYAADWHQVFVSGPPPRTRHSMVFDVSRGRVVVFGGDNGSSTNETWEFDGTSWGQIHPAVLPAAREAAAMAYSPLRQRCILFGGWYVAGDDTWEYDSQSWSQLNAGTPPAGRGGAGFAYDEARQRAVLFGGDQGSSPYGDTWELVDSLPDSTATPTSTGTDTPTSTPTATPTDTQPDVSPSATDTGNPATATFTPTRTPVPVHFVQVYQGRLNGRETALYTGGSESPRPCCGDFDSDGDYDLFLTRQDGGVSYFRNDGSRTAPLFTSLSDQYFNTGWGGARFAASDLDGDGDLDLLAGHFNASGGQLVYYQNSGTAFSPAFSLASRPGGITDNYGCPAFGDLDADGDDDLLLGGGNTNYLDSHELHFYRNVGSATQSLYALEDKFYAGVMSVQNCQPALADLDADRDLDLVLGCNDGETMLFRNTGSPESASWVLETTQYFPLSLSPVSRAHSPAFVDLDDDGDTDCLVGSQRQGVYNVENRGTPETPVWVVGSLGLPLEQVEGHAMPVFGDLDDDGDQDMVLGQYVVSRISFYTNEGTPNLASWRRNEELSFSITGKTHASPALTDVDGDGDLDLFVCDGHDSGGSSKLRFYENVGTVKDATFALVSDSYLSPDPGFTYFSYPAFADIDADGDPDLFIRPRENTVRFWRNDGTAESPNWTYVTEIYGGFAGENRGPLCFSDVDRDGDLDFASGNYDGRVAFWRNIGSATSAVWPPLPEPSLLPQQARKLSAPSFVDIDSDGDMDYLPGWVDGWISLYVNDAPKLGVSHGTSTVLGGTSIPFGAMGNTGQVTWSLANNRSGGSIEPLTGSYTSGSTTSVVDVVEVMDASGVTGRAHVNVIGPEQLAQTGKAVICAGRKAVDDVVWPASDYLSRLAYRTCLLKGFDAEHIYFLSPEAGADVDAPSNLTNLYYALTNWATDACALTVYLVDHGYADNGSGRFMLNESGDVLAAAQLDAWLDGLQNTTSMGISAIIDCCKAGSFLPSLKAPAGKNRVVVTSSAADELTYFLGTGLISFSEAFWNGIFTGNPIGRAFEHAADAMSRYQTAQLDDNADGVYEADVDGLLAATTDIGLSLIAGSDRPQFGSVIGNQTLTGTTELLLWVGEPSSSYEIEEVWAVVVPPDFQADPETNDPVIALPTVELIYSEGAKRWEALYTDFATTGTHRVIFYARDIWQSVSLPKQVYIHQTDFGGKAVVVVGEGAYGIHQGWENCSAAGNKSYTALRNRWFGDEDIDYFSPVVVGGIDGLPTLDAVADAIESASGFQQLTVYLVGAASPEQLVLSPAERLDAATLDGWLDGLQTGSNTEVVVLIECEQSGSWIDDLKPPAGKVRIVLTSTAPGRNSYCFAGALFSFSHYFWSRIFEGSNLRDAYYHAGPMLRFLTSSLQSPAIDDNGNGVPNEKADGAVAFTRFIGPAFLTGGDDLPTIGATADDIYLTGGATTATLWCAGVMDSDGIRGVTCCIIPPDWSGDPIAELAMVYDATQARYESVYTDFTTPGDYRILYLAEDREGHVSEGTYGAVYQYSTADVYETDDGPEVATLLVVDHLPPHSHNFHDHGDTDWSWFYAYEGEIYTITAGSPGVNCDPVLTLFGEEDTAAPWLDPVDEGGPQLAETLIWDCTTTGVYYLRVHGYDPAVYGTGTDYTLGVIREYGITNGQTEAVSDSWMVVRWEPSEHAGVTSFTIWRSAIDFCCYEDMGTVAGDRTCWLDRGLAANTRYFYQVFENYGSGGAGRLTEAFFGDTLAPGEAVQTYFDCSDLTLQEWLDELPSGSTLAIGDGSYTGNLTIGKPLTLIGSGSAILNGGGAGTGVLVESTGVTIAYLRIQNYAVGIRVGPTSTATIHHCNFVNNSVYAIENQNTGATVSAENCWWGRATGP